MGFEFLDKHLRKFTDAGFIVWIADVHDLAVTSVFLVLDDPEETVDAFIHLGEAALLLSAVHQQNRCAFDEIEDQTKQSMIEISEPLENII